MSWWQIHHWENTLEKAEAWLKQEQNLGYNGEIKPDGNVYLIITWRI
jgi:hypothetical protein